MERGSGGREPPRQTHDSTPKTLQLTLATDGIVCNGKGIWLLVLVPKKGIRARLVGLGTSRSSEFAHVGLSILIPLSKESSFCDATAQASSFSDVACGGISSRGLFSLLTCSAATTLWMLAETQATGPPSETSVVTTPDKLVSC